MGGQTMPNYFSYMRISTKEERALQKFARQENALAKYQRDNGISYTVQFKEDVSGKSFENRTEWQRLERLLQSGDTIVFKDISRFTREAENGYRKYMELLDKGIELIFIDKSNSQHAIHKTAFECGTISKSCRKDFVGKHCEIATHCRTGQSGTGEKNFN